MAWPSAVRTAWAFSDICSGLALYSSRLAPIRQGSVAVLSHSGALGIALAHSGRIGVSLLVSAGNAAVTDMPDYLRYLAHDDATRVALLVIEKIDDPAAFAEAVAAMHGAGKRVSSFAQAAPNVAPLPARRIRVRSPDRTRRSSPSSSGSGSSPPTTSQLR